MKGKLSDWQKQLAAAQEEIRRLEEALLKAGYVNTVHDCWEKPEEPKKGK